MGKTNDNSNIRKFLYRFVPEQTNKNPLFVKTFGKNFSNKKMKQNVLTVITNIPYPINGAAAYQCGCEITFCCSLDDIDNKLTTEQIMNDKILQQNAVHECIHAMLQRTKKQCKKYNINYGTGLLEIEKVDNNFREIGRGLNEGYTQWICEKSDLEVFSYPELTNFVRLIEIAIGTENTMQLGKGGTQFNFSKILNLPQDDVNFLLALSDQVYVADANMRTENRIISILKQKEMIDSLDEDKKLRIQEYYDNNYYLIEQYMQDPAFLNYIKTKDLAQTEESLIKYLMEESLPNHKEQKIESIISFESFILDKFFMKDLQQIFENDEVSDEDLKKLYKINSLLNTKLESIPDHIKKAEASKPFLVFKEEGNKAVGRFLKQSVEKDLSEYKSGKTNIKDFIEKLRFLFELNHNLAKAYLKNFSNMITSGELDEFKQQFFGILQHAYRNADNEDFIKSIAKLSIYKLKSKDSEKNIESILIYDKENYFDKYYSKGSLLRSVSEDYEFDFTIEMDNQDEYKKAMENFLKLQKRVFTRNPESEIHIASRKIIVQDGNNTEFYEINNGDLVPMMVEKQMDLQFSYEREKQSKEETALVPVKNNVWTNAINYIIRKINKARHKNMPDFPNYRSDSQIEENTFEVSAQHKSNNLMDKYKTEVQSTTSDTLRKKTTLDKKKGDEHII